MFCLYCGNNLPEDAVFCNRCGKKQGVPGGQVSSAPPFPGAPASHGQFLAGNMPVAQGTPQPGTFPNVQGTSPGWSNFPPGQGMYFNVAPPGSPPSTPWQTPYSMQQTPSSPFGPLTPLPQSPSAAYLQPATQPRAEQEQHSPPAGPGGQKPAGQLSRRAVLFGLVGVAAVAGGLTLAIRYLNGGPEAPVPVNSPMFGFDPQHTHFNADESILNTGNVSQLSLYWTATIGGQVVSSPAVVDGVVYIGSGDIGRSANTSLDKKLYALDAQTGAVLWSYATGDAVFSSPAVVNGVVYVGSYDKKLYALDAKTGSNLWSYSTGGSVFSSPVVADGVVYIGSEDNKLYALDAKTGSNLWSYTTGGSVDSSPAVANGVVYVGSLDKNLYAVDAKTGAMLWSYGMGSYVESSPAISNGVVYIGSSDGTLYALDAGKGTVLWSYATHTGNYIISSPAVANGVIYISSTPNNYHDNIDDKLYALDAGKGTVIWSATVSVDFSSPTVANGVVYVGSAVYTGNTNNNTPRGSGKLYAFDAKTGTALWNYAPGDIIESSPAVVNGVVYVGSYDGKLYAFHLPSSST